MTNNVCIINELTDYMFTPENINKYSKNIIENFDFIKPKQYIANIPIIKKTNAPQMINTSKMIKYIMYCPKQKDSLFWCFYILKNGFFNYEMEINNKYFTVEKNEKFKYIELLRKKKDLLKMYKIKPLIELENNLANEDKISIKTFFALCVIENINVLLVDKRKVYDCLSELYPINIVHRNNNKHMIELDPTEESIKKYKETYYKISDFNDKLKSIGSYKLDELIELSKKLDIHLDKEYDKKITKKYIYEQIMNSFTMLV
jgi:hypothetical protein